MKKYLFGLGAMLVGAGLMFVLMHGEVSAESDNLTKFTCKQEKIMVQGKYEGTYGWEKEEPMVLANICTGHGLKCVFSTATSYPSVLASYNAAGVSCIKS